MERNDEVKQIKRVGGCEVAEDPVKEMGKTWGKKTGLSLSLSGDVQGRQEERIAKEFAVRERDMVQRLACIRAHAASPLARARACTCNELSFTCACTK